MNKKVLIIALVVVIVIVAIVAVMMIGKKSGPVQGSKVPAVTKVVSRNNGTISCNAYCAGAEGNPWNGELPVEWNGAKCVGTNRPGLGCNDIAGLTTGLQCTCAPTGTGWNPESMDSIFTKLGYK